MKSYLSYSSEKTKLRVQEETVEIKAYQVIVWVSIAHVVGGLWDPRLPKFPAILDIGHTHNLALTDVHLRRWAGIHAASLPRLGTMRKDNARFPVHQAKVWLHSDDEPFPLDIAGGIAISDTDWPRLPILGLRALTNSKLQTVIYGDTKRVIIRTPPKWYWPF